MAQAPAVPVDYASAPLFATRAWPDPLVLPFHFGSNIAVPSYLSNLHGPIPKRTYDLTNEQVIQTAQWLLLNDTVKACEVLARVGTYKGLGQAQRVVEQMHQEFEDPHRRAQHYHSCWHASLKTVRLGTVCQAGVMTTSPCSYPPRASERVPLPRPALRQQTLAPAVHPPPPAAGPMDPAPCLPGAAGPNHLPVLTGRASPSTPPNAASGASSPPTTSGASGSAADRQ